MIINQNIEVNLVKVDTIDQVKEQTTGANVYVYLYKQEVGCFVYDKKGRFYGMSYWLRRLLNVDNTLESHMEVPKANCIISTKEV